MGKFRHSRGSGNPAPFLILNSGDNSGDTSLNSISAQSYGNNFDQKKTWANIIAEAKMISPQLSEVSPELKNISIN
jgi:hypothetical protein